MLDENALEPGSHEDDLLAAYHYIAAVAGSSNGWGGLNIDLRSGFELYFGEDGPGELLPPDDRSLVRRLMPWLIGEAARIRADVERERRPPQGAK